jgi:crossover junction endodeoxyribonuclease RusA
MTYTIELPYPPSVNTYWRHITIKGKARTVVSASGREYSVAVIAEVLSKGRPATFEGRLSLDMTIHPPDLKRRDLDNTAKALLDALAKARVYEDDSQIDDLRIRRGKATKPGRVVVTVTEIAKP